MPERQTAKLSLKFPKRFLWGAATAAHQVEGGTHNQWSVFELENARALASKAPHIHSWLPVWEEVKDQATDPNNYISGKATDHYNRFEQDFDLMKKMGLNAFRFSVEWSRIEPEEGKWNSEAIAHYRDYIKALKDRGIEPMMTLMHWTLPVWFHDMGGFEKRSNVKYFVRFAEKVLQEIGTDVRYVCTINEPEVYMYYGWVAGEWPPNKTSKWKAFRVYMNLAAAHRRVYKAAHKISRRFKVGLSKNCAHHYPGDDAVVSRFSALFAEWAADHFFLNRVRRQQDWLGLNYYFSNRYYGYRVHNPEEYLNDMGWDMQPENIEHVIERLHDKYKVPIIVTENGLADRNDTYRKWWITRTLIGINKAILSGAVVDGYLYWSLLDNFEWAHGKWPRFGLIEVDYETFERKPRKSALWYSRLVKQMRGLHRESKNETKA
jgi:beta-glucosidase